MVQFHTLKHDNDLSPSEAPELLANFLYTHVGQYGDPKDDILKAIDYAFSKASGKGGFVLVGYQHAQRISGWVANATGMGGDIPEYIFVYAAVHADYRNQGIGTAMTQQAIDMCDGDIAGHVDPHNPAKQWWERLGCIVKYEAIRDFKKQQHKHVAEGMWQLKRGTGHIILNTPNTQ